jgi:hypothetical protein
LLTFFALEPLPGGSTFACGEQGKLLPPKNASAERDKGHVRRKQRASCRSSRWTEKTTVINPLEGAIMDADQKLHQQTDEQIQKAVPPQKSAGELPKRPEGRGL